MAGVVGHLGHLDSILGQGNQAVVFKCTFHNTPVAIKRIQLVDINSNEKEEGALKNLTHPNVIKLLKVESDTNFRYYFLELCAASLDKLFLPRENPQKYNGPMPLETDVLYQLAVGLVYIHEKGLIHRDLKPENVLIWVSPENGQVLMKWADFGLSKRLNERGSYSISGVKGTLHWIAPEILKNEEITQLESRKRGTIKSDVFSEGLVFGYFLLKGLHLFGLRRREIDSNIHSNKPVNLENIQIQYARDLIRKMIAKESNDRITSSDVVKCLEQAKEPPQMKLDPVFTEKTRTELQNQLFALCEADTYPNLEEIIKIIGKGVDINCTDDNGWTALFLLAQWKKNGGDNLIDLIRYFIKNGANLNYKEQLGMNVLLLLCGSYQKENLIDLIRLLIENKIDVNCTDNDGSTALHLLCNSYQNINLITAIQLLTQHGVGVNCKNNFGWNAIHFLCQNYRKENLIDTIQYLIDQGIEVNCQNNVGSTALHLLCNNYQHENLIDLIQLLIKNGIKVNSKDNNNRNALHILCRQYRKRNLIEIIRLLIQNGSDVTEQTRINLMMNNKNPEEIREITELLILHMD